MILDIICLDIAMTTKRGRGERERERERERESPHNYKYYKYYLVSFYFVLYIN